MIHPRSLQIRERRPPAAQWTCTEHGPLEPGETECEECQEAAR